MDEDIKSIDSVETLMSKLTSNYKINLQLILKYLAKETFAQKGYILMYDEDNNRYIPLVHWMEIMTGFLMKSIIFGK